MNSRRGSTMSPISLAKISSASARVADLDLQQRAHIGIERRLPKLLGIYFAQTFVALQIDALAARLVNGFEQRARPGYDLDLVLALQLRGLVVHLDEMRMALVQAPRIERAEQRAIERMHFRHAAHFALEHETVVAEAALPARLHLFRNVVETFRDPVGRGFGLLADVKDRRIEDAADGALLDDIAIVA